MIYDYQDQEGWVSVWVGSCGRWAALDEYLSDVYLEEWENCRPHPKALEALAKVFLPENAGRPFEEELRDCFNGESYSSATTSALSLTRTSGRQRCWRPRQRTWKS